MYFSPVPLLTDTSKRKHDKNSDLPTEEKRQMMRKFREIMTIYCAVTENLNVWILKERTPSVEPPGKRGNNF